MQIQTRHTMDTMTYHDIPLHIVHFIPWHTVTHHHIPWHTITCFITFFITYHDIRLHTLTYDYIPLFHYRKVAKHRVFAMICSSGGSESRLATAAAPEQAGHMRDEKLHTVVARSKVKSVKNWRVRSTFGSWDVEKVHTVVARSTCRSQKCKKLTGSDHFWKLRCRKSGCRCGEKHISKSKGTKHTRSGPLLEVEMSKKCTPLWHEARSEVKLLKTQHARTTFGRSDIVSRGRRKGLCTLSKVSQTWGFCSISKNDGRRGTLEEDLQRCTFRGRRSTRDMFIRDVRRSGHWFPGLHFGASDLQVCWDDFAWQVQHFGWPGSTFSWQAQYWGRKIAKRIGTRPSTLH